MPFAGVATAFSHKEGLFWPAWLALCHVCVAPSRDLCLLGLARHDAQLETYALLRVLELSTCHFTRHQPGKRSFNARR